MIAEKLTVEHLKKELALPVICAPMFLISGPDLVVAACRAGIVGSFPLFNRRTTAELIAWLDDIVTRLEEMQRSDPAAYVAPWSANINTHTSNPRFDEDLELIVRYRVPIVITALGSPKRVVEPVHAYGGLVIADANSPALARKAADCGVDGLALVASGSGGHTGAVSPFAFVREVRRWWDGAIVLGGAIGDAVGIRAAEVLGADLAYMGTRFIATPESLAEPEHKRMIVEAGVDDLVISNALTGATASWLKPSLIASGLDPKTLKPREDGYRYRGLLGNVPKPWKGIFSAGQGIGSIDRVETVADIVGELKRDYVRRYNGSGA
ncbi:MAG: nitronate monooxygenase [Alphaproteobacteria bacterium]|nr:nitronate monooxygenase [Alphaproteobacteria bacterium]MCW5740513.1 nitronate monooxygenase [Alphaproteobacteria bacterium]